MCGSNSAQKDAQAAQAKFYNTMTQNYQTQFSQSQSIFNDLKSSFEPIVQAGINQEGFSAGEKAALNTQATEGVANNYKNAATAVAGRAAAQGGGNAFLPSGATTQIQGDMASSAAGQLSSEQNTINLNDYAQGRQNYLQAAGILGGSTGVYNGATSAGGVANTAGADSAQTANEIATQNNSWMGAVGGAVGGTLGGWASGGFKH